MDNNRASRPQPKLWTHKRVVGEHSNQRRRSTVRYSGAIGREDVGISNDNAGENPAHRKPKVSWTTLIGPGLVGP